MADEFDQFKATPTTGDEFAQYKTNTPAQISALPSQPEKPFQKFQGSFYERAASQFSQDLNNLSPANLLPSWRELALPGASFLSEAANHWQQAKNQLEGKPNPQVDPAETVGHMGVPAVMGLITHAADMAGNPMQAAAERPLPQWKTNPQEPQAINWQGSTPQEVQAHLQRMASRPRTMRPEGAPNTPVPESQYQVQTIPVAGPKTPSIQGANPRLPEMQASQSTTIAQHGYDPAKQQMFVQFKNGNTYRYSGVPQKVYEDYAGSESQGSFHSQQIKGRYKTDLVGKGKPSPGQQVREALSVGPSGRQVSPQILAVQSQGGGTGVSPDVGNWQPPPESGVSNIGDIESRIAKGRAAVEQKMGPLKRGGK